MCGRVCVRARYVDLRADPLCMYGRDDTSSVGRANKGGTMPD